MDRIAEIKSELAKEDAARRSLDSLRRTMGGGLASSVEECRRRYAAAANRLAELDPTDEEMECISGERLARQLGVR